MAFLSLIVLYQIHGQTSLQLLILLTLFKMPYKKNFKLGDGKAILFWLDCWLAKTPLQFLFPRLFALSQVSWIIEMVGHLFLHYKHIWILWNKFLNWLSIRWCMLESIGKMLTWWGGIMKGKLQSQAIALLSNGIFWGIWLVRNKLVFEDQLLD